MEQRSVKGLLVLHGAALAVIFLAAWGLESIAGPSPALATFGSASFWILFVVGVAVCAFVGKVTKAWRMRSTRSV